MANRSIRLPACNSLLAYKQGITFRLLSPYIGSKVLYLPSNSMREMCPMKNWIVEVQFRADERRASTSDEVAFVSPRRCYALRAEVRHTACISRRFKLAYCIIFSGLLSTAMRGGNVRR